jgi:sugar lactone lactonase YvrE
LSPSSRWEVAAELRADVGEGPAWDAEHAALLFVDITPGRLYRFAPATGRLEDVLLGGSLSAALPSTPGPLVLTRQDGVYLYEWGAGGRLRMAVPIEADDQSTRLNDAAVDPRGRLWTGSIRYDFRAGASTLYRCDAGGPVAVLTGCAIANGTGWSPDGTTMYFVDTPTGRIDRLDYDVATGEASGRRLFAQVRPEDGMPDGLTVDAEGGVWVALWDGSAVRRFGPDGQLTEVVELPVSKASSVCFGGDDLRDLYVTTACHQLTATQRKAEPLAGSLFVVRPGVAGLATAAVDLATLGIAGEGMPS